MANNVTFQSKRAATPPKDTDVATIEDHNGDHYQRVLDGLDYTLLYYDANDNVEYVCKNTDPEAATSDTDWQIKKLTYSGNNVTSILAKTGSVDGRVALFS